MNCLEIFISAYTQSLTERIWNIQYISKGGFNFKINKVLIFYNLIFFFQNFSISSKYFELIRNLADSNLTKIYITKFYLKGVGYKFLKIRSQQNVLKIELGHSSFTYFKIPQCIKIFHKRDRLILLSFQKDELAKFSHFIFKLRPADVYKGKGVRLSTVSYTTFKTGKQR